MHPLQTGKTPNNQCDCFYCRIEMFWWSFSYFYFILHFQKGILKQCWMNPTWWRPCSPHVSASGRPRCRRCKRVNTISLDLTAAILARFLPEAHSNKHLRASAAGWCASVMRLRHMTDMQCSCLFSTWIQMIPVETMSIYCLTYQSFLLYLLGEEGGSHIHAIKHWLLLACKRFQIFLIYFSRPQH